MKAVKSPSVASFHVAEGILSSSAAFTLTRDVTELWQMLLFVTAKHFVKKAHPEQTVYSGLHVRELDSTFS